MPHLPFCDFLPRSGTRPQRQMNERKRASSLKLPPPAVQRRLSLGTHSAEIRLVRACPPQQLIPSTATETESRNHLISVLKGPLRSLGLCSYGKGSFCVSSKMESSFLKPPPGGGASGMSNGSKVRKPLLSLRRPPPLSLS